MMTRNYHPNRTKMLAITAVAWIGFATAFFLSASALSSRQTPTKQSFRTTSSVKPPFLAIDTDPSGSKNNNDGDDGFSTRRQSLLAIACACASAIATTTIVAPPEPARALFPNAMPEAKKYADRPKRKGDAPKDLGVLSRTTEGIDATKTSPRLRTCSGNPNCFSTTGDALLEDRQMYGVDFLVAPWVPSPEDETKPLKVLAAVMGAYEPGQGGVDGGGFALVKETDSYLYYQFEALKKGYIDDVEFATHPTTKGLMVRSASRVGVTDFGVNAIRLNYIAGKLRDRGWKIAEITPETHRDYWTTANDAREATFDEDRRRMDAKMD